ncbi:MAG TPA: SpoIIE family protein phosphatase [Bacteroidales bacterium]|nr:SpoIIE family protein phosphatase [Bacteroidales bacterium]
MWSKIIYNTGDQLIQDLPERPINYKKFFTEQIAEGLYRDIQPAWNLVTSSNTSKKEFNNLSEDEKSFWYIYTEEIPDKFLALNLFVRPFEDFCRTCIITDDDITTLIQMDHERYCRGISSKSLKKNNTRTIINEIHPAQKYFQSLTKDWQRFYLEMNYLIPIQFKKIGYEIIRPEEAVEIDLSMIRKLARAIHSKYLHEIRNQNTRVQDDPDTLKFYNPGDSENQYTSDFDDLTDEIKYSNIDNAAHIPTKLLSIGYKIRLVKKGFKPVALHLSEEEIETMSQVEHIRWSWEKRLNGWRFGKSRNSIKKTHPSLLPYEELSEPEKEKDRELVKLIPALLLDINYEIFPVSPNRINKLSYAIKPQSNIHKLLCETRRLGEEVSNLALTSPKINDKIISINKIIEETIREVQGSYNYARHIQETFLPEDLYIRECFPDSFVLYKPKNIVSGDFYFFSKHGDLVIFALADCTGHGIPGALISTIGYGSLDQVVNVKKITDPADILRNLYSLVHRFMRRNLDRHGLQDDLDITLCLLDTRTNLLTLAGVGNLIYYVTEGNIIEIKSDYYKDDCNQKHEYRFTSKKIQMKIGDTLYLCSDGYADQFGGNDHKRYQRKKLMGFLLRIRDCPMAEQSDMLNEEIEKWREEQDEDQTDDISIIGIRI